LLSDRLTKELEKWLISVRVDLLLPKFVQTLSNNSSLVTIQLGDKYHNTKAYVFKDAKTSLS
jgi:hypothetical protein